MKEKEEKEKLLKEKEEQEKKYSRLVHNFRVRLELPVILI